MAHRSGDVLLHDPLNGTARGGWRVPPDRFVDAPGGGAAYLIEPGAGKTIANPPWAGNESWETYRIEFDVCTTGEKDGWVGPDYHVRDTGEGCCNLQFYSTRERAEVVFETSARWWADDLAWKLFPMAGRAVRMPKGEWARVRADVGDTFANVFVNGEREPCYTIRHLPFSRGGVRLWNYLGSAFFRDLRVTALGPGEIGPILADPWDTVLRKEIVRGWMMSRPIAGGAGESEGPAVVEPGVAWREAGTDARGIVLVSGAGREYVAGKGVVFAKASIHSPEEDVRGARITYTDQLTMWVNGREVFRGARRGWNDPGRSEADGFGRLMPDQFGVKLPLRKGDNEVVVRLEVNEPLYGSGFWMRLE